MKKDAVLWITFPHSTKQIILPILGIHIVPDVGRIVQTNYDPTFESIYKSIERWSNMPISLIGRINILKMNVLPKLLHLFQNIPLPLPLSDFTKLRKT